MMPLNVPKPKPSPFEEMRAAIQARGIKRGTDWEYLSEADRRVLSATALQAGDDEWLNETGELLPQIVAVLNTPDASSNPTTRFDLCDAAITIAHHSGKWLYEDTWPRMDVEDFCDGSQKMPEYDL